MICDLRLVSYIHFMARQSYILFALLIVGLISCHQRTSKTTQQPTTSVDTLTSDYYVELPMSWRREFHPFPLDFAPGIPYKGFADVLFPPQWGDASSNQFWSYMGIWRLTDAPPINDTSLTRVIEQYYTGLARKPRQGNTAPGDSTTVAIAKVTKIKTDSADTATYEATANIFDGNISMSRMTLQFKILEIPSKQANIVFLILEMSPKPYTDSIWKTMDGIKSQFRLL